MNGCAFAGCGCALAIPLFFALFLFVSVAMSKLEPGDQSFSTSFKFVIFALAPGTLGLLAFYHGYRKSMLHNAWAKGTLTKKQQRELDSYLAQRGINTMQSPNKMAK